MADLLHGIPVANSVQISNDSPVFLLLLGLIFLPSAKFTSGVFARGLIIEQSS